MKKIEKAGVVGLGTLETMYAHILTNAMGRNQVFVFADADRVNR